MRNVHNIERTQISLIPNFININKRAEDVRDANKETEGTVLILATESGQDLNQ
jgi:hypothetical protein